MAVSKLKLACIIFIILCSLLVGNILDHITVKRKLLKPANKSFKHPFDGEGDLGASDDHLMWFLQISDLHISVFYDPERIDHLKEFCDVTVDVIRPSVVVASGDLTDSKNIDAMGSTQYIDEWKHYNRILQESKVAEKTLWLDIRGNHDNFNVPSIKSASSYFHKYSIQGKKHLRSYMYTVTKGSSNYSFIALDACLNPGPRRPFNFIGNIQPDEYELLKTFEKESQSADAAIWFGHYPTSCILSPAPGVRNLMENATAYLCGHLHTLGGVVPNMYALQHEGFLELELGDWKENRLYRLAAFDHGLFSFTDVLHGQWPVILVTNPKNPLFGLPHKESIDYMMKSTHIRLIVFSPTPLTSVKLHFGDENWVECEHVNGPLYISAWNPSQYNSGSHNIYVTAMNSAGEKTTISHQFSFDGSHQEFRLMPRLALMTDATTVFLSVFGTLVCISVLPLFVLRMVHRITRGQLSEGSELRYFKSFDVVRKLWIVATINKLFYPLVLYPIYITIGPWFIGEIIEGHMGVAFAWGTYVDGKFLPGAFSYFYGVVQLFWFHIPFIYVLAQCVEFRFRILCLNDESCSYKSHFFYHAPCALVVFAQFLYAYYFWLAYGTIALFLGPLRTWSAIMGFYLWFTVVNLRDQDFAEARLVWKKRSDSIRSENGLLHSHPNHTSSD